MPLFIKERANALGMPPLAPAAVSRPRHRSSIAPASMTSVRFPLAALQAACMTGYRVTSLLPHIVDVFLRICAQHMPWPSPAISPPPHHTPPLHCTLLFTAHTHTGERLDLVLRFRLGGFGRAFASLHTYTHLCHTLGRPLCMRALPTARNKAPIGDATSAWRTPPWNHARQHAMTLSYKP